MFARIKKSGRYQYLQIVENRRDKGKISQRVIGTVGRLAPALARRMVTQWGMSERLGPVSYKLSDDDPFLGREMHAQRQFSEHTMQIVDEEVARILHDAADRFEYLPQPVGKFPVFALNGTAGNVPGRVSLEIQNRKRRGRGFTKKLLIYPPILKRRFSNENVFQL